MGVDVLNLTNSLERTPLTMQYKKDIINSNNIEIYNIFFKKLSFE